MNKSFIRVTYGSIKGMGKFAHNGNMKNWLAPIALLGLSGVGLLVASSRGRERVGTFLEGLGRSGDPLTEVGKFFEDQLDAIQHALDRLAESLEEQNT